MSDSQPSEQRNPTFEETYPCYEFSELVRLSMALGAWLAGGRRARAVAAPPAPVEQSRRTGPTAPAT
jgi:hypothetical protein